jgi:hypothetical protein
VHDRVPSLGPSHRERAIVGSREILLNFNEDLYLGQVVPMVF